MKFAIITHVKHLKKSNEYFGYAPYVREMNIWLKYVDKIIVVAPLSTGNPSAIDLAYIHSSISFRKVPNFNLTDIREIVLTILKLPFIFWKIFWAMKSADHIHLRCPGNMGLIACFVQIFFPNKIKTAKYAGNWDSTSKQAWSYRLQKRILNNTFLTRNMQVLVYGDWENQSKNIKSFFTATYSESEKNSIEKTDFENGIKFIFVGSLVVGKNPLYAVKLVEVLLKNGRRVTLDLYGEGIERSGLENYIQVNRLENHITLRGNHNQEALKNAYKESHFVILPSKSEGWPKAIAEGMFWGCIPIATKVSCVPSMLNYEERGVLLEMDLDKDAQKMEDLIINQNSFLKKSKLATDWSHNFTTDLFENEIAKLLIK